jgi:hypothetical protein
MAVSERGICPPGGHAGCDNDDTIAPTLLTRADEVIE